MLREAVGSRTALAMKPLGTLGSVTVRVRAIGEDRLRLVSGTGATMLPESVPDLMVLGGARPFCCLVRLITGVVDIRVSTPVPHTVWRAGEGEELAVGHRAP